MRARRLRNVLAVLAVLTTVAATVSCSPEPDELLVVFRSDRG